MKILIFAGGHGTRLWPLSRKNSPKQFEKMFDGKSTLQLLVDRVKDDFGAENIFISTGEVFKDIILDQLPDIPEENIISEPAKRDLAAAVGLSFATLKQRGVTGAVSILWSDSLVENVSEFQNALRTGEELINSNPNRFTFIGEIPRFANNNLGWITIGETLETRNGIDVHSFEGWVYRPETKECNRLFNSKKAVWNTGYFTTSVDFVVNLYKKHMPDMYTALEKMAGDKDHLESHYAELEAISFDEAIVEKAKPEEAVVLTFDIGWSDPGTLYALKEALAESPESNHVVGKVVEMETKDSLIYNQDPDKLVTAIGLDGFVVVNTKDALIVCPKDKVREITKLLKKVEEEGLEEYL